MTGTAAEPVHRATRKTQNVLGAVVKLMAMAVVLMALVGLGYVAYTSSQNKDSLDSGAAILKQVQDSSSQTQKVLTFLVDCTTVGHACYDNATKNGNSRSTQIEQVVTQTLIATATCRAQGHDQSFAILKRCVEKYVK